MAQQAKCVRCKIRFEWKRNKAIRSLRCPYCKGPLRATSYQWTGRVEHREPDVQAVLELPRVHLIVDAGTPAERTVECFADLRLREFRAVSNPHEVYRENDLDTDMESIIAQDRASKVAKA